MREQTMNHLIILQRITYIPLLEDLILFYTHMPQIWDRLPFCICCVYINPNTSLSQLLPHEPSENPGVLNLTKMFKKEW